MSLESAKTGAGRRRRDEVVAAVEPQKRRSRVLGRHYRSRLGQRPKEERQ